MWSITAHSWCGGHSINISIYGVWRAMAGVQVFRRKFHTHIHLNYSKIEFLSCIK